VVDGVRWGTNAVAVVGDKPCSQSNTVATNRRGDDSPRLLVGLRTSGDYSPRGEPTISPKAQLSNRISIEMFETLFGTLTATGTRPRPQQLPGNLASATILPVALSVTTISGDLPTGFQSLYSSLVAP
jgi:hypothetical protein